MFQFFILNVEHFIRCSSVGMGLNESWFLVCSRDLLSANMWSTLNALCGEKVLCMLLGLREQEKKEGREQQVYEICWITMMMMMWVFRVFRATSLGKQHFSINNLLWCTATSAPFQSNFIVTIFARGLTWLLLSQIWHLMARFKLNDKGRKPTPIRFDSMIYETQNSAELIWIGNSWRWNHFCSSCL